MVSSDKSHPLKSLRRLPEREKPPASARILDSWLAALQTETQQAVSRLGWLVGATVVIAVLQRVVDDEGLPVFVVKGGTSLQIQLGDIGRLTRDLDGIVRGHSFQDFLRQVDEVIAEPWGPISLRRAKGRLLDVGPLAIPLFRFDVLLTIRGRTWRRIPVELSMAAGLEGRTLDRVHAPPLWGLGLPTPQSIFALSMSYQIAQKIHAATAPHRPPGMRNDRFRDVIDLVLLRRVMATAGEPSRRDVLEALQDVFKTRAEIVHSRHFPPRQFPPVFIPWPHWTVSFDRAISEANLSGSLEELCDELNVWIQEIVSADEYPTPANQ